MIRTESDIRCHIITAADALRIRQAYACSALTSGSEIDRRHILERQYEHDIVHCTGNRYDTSSLHVTYDMPLQPQYQGYLVTRVGLI